MFLESKIFTTLKQLFEHILRLQSFWALPDRTDLCSWNTHMSASHLNVHQHAHYEPHLMRSSVHTAVTPGALYYVQCEPCLNTLKIYCLTSPPRGQCFRWSLSLTTLYGSFSHAPLVENSWPLGCHVGGRYAQCWTRQRNALSFFMLNKSEYRQKTGCQTI